MPGEMSTETVFERKGVEFPTATTLRPDPGGGLEVRDSTGSGGGVNAQAVPGASAPTEATTGIALISRGSPTVSA